MAYKMVSPSLYPFRRENAKFFSQDLIENVLFDFGHIWKPVRSKREIRLRDIAHFIFTPPIGQLVAYISRKYSGTVVMKCFITWNYINSHRPSVRDRMLCNEIVTLCTRSELESDDLGLLTFMAMVTEYARLALTHEQEILIETVVNALSYCLTDKIPGGFVTTLERMEKLALNFSYPRNYIVCDYDPKTQFVSPVSTESVYTPRSEFESPIMLEYNFPASSRYSTPTEDIVTEMKNRELHRELFRRKMMVDRSTQTEMESESSQSTIVNIGQLNSVVVKSEMDFVEKIEIQKDSDSSTPEGIFLLVERSDMSVQTWSSIGEQSNKSCTEIDKVEEGKDKQKSAAVHSMYKHELDLNAVIEKLKEIEKLQIEDRLPGSSCSDITNHDIKMDEERKNWRVEKLLNTLTSQSVGSQEFESDTEIESIVYDTRQKSQLQKLKIKCPSEIEVSNNSSLVEGQFLNLDVGTDNSNKLNLSEKLKATERLQVGDGQLGSSCSNVTNLDVAMPDDGKGGRGTNILNMLQSQSISSRELDTDTEKQSIVYSEHQEIQSQHLEKKCPSDMDVSNNSSLVESQFGSHDASTDDPTKIGDEHYPRRENYSSDSQIGSLDESIRTSDESRLED